MANSHLADSFSNYNMEMLSVQPQSKGRSDKSPGEPVITAQGLQSDSPSIAGGTLSKHSKLIYLACNILFIIPGLLFLTYAGLVVFYNGRQIDVHPLPELQSAARYGPTIFPVAFAAVIGAFLTNYAAWRLERGISMLSLEHLLNTRTVFGAVVMPFSLRSANLLALLLLALWALSPLGGQAALRIIEVEPWTHSEPWSYQYLDVMSRQQVCSPLSSSGMDLMPPIVGAFNAALATPGRIKNQSMDAFGNLKIPMIESCLNKGGKPDQDGWVDTVTSDCAYASINGLPFRADRGLGFANYTFTLETSYTYSDCSLNHTLAGPNETWVDWYTSLVNKTDVNNGVTLSLSLLGLDTSFRNDSQKLLVESITSNAKTQATCSLSQTYVETEVFCYHDDCAVKRIRNSALPHNATYFLPLHGQWGNMSVAMPCAGGLRGFLSGLVKSSMFMSMYGSSSATDPYSTPLEYYMVNPDLPYSAYSSYSTNGSAWRGADIYPIGAAAFSERFAQLWNTWWLCNIAPEAAMGVFERKFNGYSWNYNVVNATGTMAPDFMQLRCNMGWLAALVVASVVMLGASVANIVVGLLQTRPDILYRISVLVKDNPQTVATYKDRVPRRDAEVRMKDVHLSLRDGGGKGSGYAKVRTVDDDVSRA
jgi:hypothetical protein